MKTIYASLLALFEGHPTPTSGFSSVADDLRSHEIKHIHFDNIYLDENIWISGISCFALDKQKHSI